MLATLPRSPARTTRMRRVREWSNNGCMGSATGATRATPSRRQAIEESPRHLRLRSIRRERTPRSPRCRHRGPRRAALRADGDAQPERRAADRGQRRVDAPGQPARTLAIEDGQQRRCDRHHPHQEPPELDVVAQQRGRRRRGRPSAPQARARAAGFARAGAARRQEEPEAGQREERAEGRDVRLDRQAPCSGLGPVMKSCVVGAPRRRARPHPSLRTARVIARATRRAACRRNEPRRLAQPDARTGRGSTRRRAGRPAAALPGPRMRPVREVAVSPQVLDVQVRRRGQDARRRSRRRAGDLPPQQTSRADRLGDHEKDERRGREHRGRLGAERQSEAAPAITRSPGRRSASPERAKTSAHAGRTPWSGRSALSSPGAPRRATKRQASPANSCGPHAGAPTSLARR